MPSDQPMAAKTSDVPASVKATGKPMMSTMQVTANMTRLRISPISALLIPWPRPGGPGRRSRESRGARARCGRPWRGPADRPGCRRRDDGLVEEEARQAAGLAAHLEAQPRRLHVGDGVVEDDADGREQQEQHADQVDPGLEALARRPVEDVDPDMAVMQQGVARRQHEQRAVHPDIGLLDPDAAPGEAVAGDHDEDGDEHHGEGEPRDGAPDDVVEPVDAAHEAGEKMHLSSCRCRRCLAGRPASLLSRPVVASTQAAMRGQSGPGRLRRHLPWASKAQLDRSGSRQYFNLEL
jgi:hypothetical protein